MIVKNESHVIKRCLESVKHLISYWVIVDTGSTDGTQDIIREYLKDIPGELHERPWVNFGHNRNEALALARKKSDYILFMDADDRLVFSKKFAMPELNKPYYHVIQHVKNIKSPTTPPALHQILLMIKSDLDLTWVGALHENPMFNATKHELLPGVINEYLHDGFRSQDPDRVKNDIEILKKAIAEDPSNARNVFYLAQTYRSAEDFQSALKYYEQRAGMGGAQDELFYSVYCMGLMQLILKMDPDLIIKNLSSAFRFRPTRIEPLYALTSHFIETENYLLGYLVSKCGISLPAPHDLFVESWMYDWGILAQHYLCLLKIGKLDKAYEILQKLLANPNLPAQNRAELQQHLPELQKSKEQRV